MRLTTSTRQFLLWPPRLVGLVAVTLTLSGIVLTMLFHPEGFVGNDLEDALTETALLATLVLLGTLLAKRPLISAFSLLVAFVGSLVTGSILFLLSRPIGTLIGFGNLLYFYAVLFMVYVALAGSSRREGG